MKMLNVSDTSVRRYIRKAREAGYIFDTYEDNRQRMIERMRGQYTRDSKVRDFIFEHITPIEPAQTTPKKKSSTKRKSVK